ncbi:unnamed protein product [Sphagnum balticum]
MYEEDDEFPVPSQMPPRKLTTTHIENKANALRRLQEGVTVSQVARENNVSRKTVRDWRQKSEQIFAQEHKRDRRRTVGLFEFVRNVNFNHYLAVCMVISVTCLLAKVLLIFVSWLVLLFAGVGNTDTHVYLSHYSEPTMACSTSQTCSNPTTVAQQPQETQPHRQNRAVVEKLTTTRCK